MMDNYVLADGRDSYAKKPDLPQPLMGTSTTFVDEWVKAE